jgi:flagellar motor switch protein FliG
MEQVDVPLVGSSVLSRLSLHDQVRAAIGSLAGEPFDDELVAALARIKGGSEFVEATSCKLAPRDFAAIFGNLDSFSQRRLRERLDEVAPGARAWIDDELFSFDDLESMEKRSVRAVLHEVDDRTIMLALHGAGPYMHVSIFAALGVERARVIKNLFETTSAVPFDEVETAQRMIESATRRLVESGTITPPLLHAEPDR